MTGDSMPPWLTALGVKRGEYFIDSKRRAQRAIQIHAFSPAARIHIYLGLATMGFQQELAVKMKAGKRVPVSPADVCTATNISRNHFRRYMAELKAMGLAECRGSTKGNVEIYSWAVPRDVDESRIVTAHVDNLEIVCEDGEPVSDSIVSALKHCRFQGGLVATRGDIAELERRALVAKTAELSLRELAERLRAKQPYKRKKETVINIERNDERTMQRLPEPTPDLPATREPGPDCPSVVLEEKIRTYLSARAEQLGLPTVPDITALRKIAAYITDEARFVRFERQLSIQKSHPNSWMYFVPIAKACAEAHAAALTTAAAPAGEKTALTPGFTEALTNRMGDGSLESFRKTSGKVDATFEDMNEAYEGLLTEFGTERKI